MSVQRLVLGSAQFGLEGYGIRNTLGKPSLDTLHALVEHAFASGVQWIDTAEAYGDAEIRLGWCKVSRFLVCTKLAPNLFDRMTNSPEIPHTVAERVTHITRAHLERSVERLALGRPPDVYLMHSARYAFHGEIMGGFLLAAQQAGVRYAGVSCYTPEEALTALAHGATAIQVPFNLFDLRALSAGVFTAAARRGALVFARAPFLQGLLCAADVPMAFMTQARIPDPVLEILPRLTRLAQYARGRGVSPATVALSAALQASSALVVFGCESPVQLVHNILTAASPVPTAFLDLAPTLGGSMEAVVNPSLWAQPLTQGA